MDTKKLLAISKKARQERKQEKEKKRQERLQEFNRTAESGYIFSFTRF